jgi:hypothetical protein
MQMVSSGVIKLTAVNDETTKVSWTNEGDFGTNPALRYLGLFMDNIIGPDFEAGLASLKILVEKRAVADIKANADAAPPPIDAVNDAAKVAAAAPPATADAAPKK